MASPKLITVALLALASSLANASRCKPSTTSASPEPTSTLPCPAYTPVAVVSDGKVCGKEVQRSGQPSDYRLLTRPASLEDCVKLCADTQTCVSLYVELYDPRESPPYPICHIFSQKMDDSNFFLPPTAGITFGHYYELGCYECDRRAE